MPSAGAERGEGRGQSADAFGRRRGRAPMPSAGGADAFGRRRGREAEGERRSFGRRSAVGFGRRRESERVLTERGVIAFREAACGRAWNHAQDLAPTRSRSATEIRVTTN